MIAIAANCERRLAWTLRIRDARRASTYLRCAYYANVTSLAFVAVERHSDPSSRLFLVYTPHRHVPVSDRANGRSRLRAASARAIAVDDNHYARTSST